MVRKFIIYVFAISLIATIIYLTIHKSQFSTTTDLNPAIVDTLIKLATIAGNNGDVPIAAVIVYQTKIIGTGFNTLTSKKNAGGHAEINALSDAISKLGLESFKKLNRDSLYLITTYEPCLMCQGALVEYQIKKTEVMKFKSNFERIKENLKDEVLQFNYTKVSSGNLQDSLFSIYAH